MTYKKDYYTILGVEPNASEQEIREAYLSKVRVIHPDRFDPGSKEWVKANEMLAELNEAYSIISENLNLYQKSNTHHQDSASSSKADKQTADEIFISPFGPGDLTSGVIRFSDLPERVKDKILARQRNECKNQLQIKIGSIFKTIIWLVLLLGWFVFLFISTQGIKWENDILLLYGIITVAVSLLFCKGLIKIIEWCKSTLKPFFYLTPLYFIETNNDLIYLHPIWTLKDISVIHNYRNHSYQNSTVNLKFTDGVESLILHSQELVNLFFVTLNNYKNDAKNAFMNNNYQYFVVNDDFYGIPRKPTIKSSIVGNNTKRLLYFATTVFSGVLFYISYNMNISYYNKRWIKHPTPSYTQPKTKASSFLGSQGPEIPERPIPPHGALQIFTSKKRIAPFEVNTDKGNYYLIKLIETNSNKTVLTIFIHGGSSLKIDVPIGDYELKYAVGKKWYGYEYLFGPDTSYYKADKIFRFYIEGDYIKGYSVSLYKVSYGNLQTVAISPEEF